MLFPVDNIPDRCLYNIHGNDAKAGKEKIVKYVKGYDAEIISVERMKNSRNGNPKYLAVFQHSGGVISAFTKTDSMLAYKIKQFTGKPVYVEIGQHYGLNTIDSISG